MRSIRALKLAIPVNFIWVVLLLTLLPDLLNGAGFDFGRIDWPWKSFLHLALETVSVTLAFMIVIMSFVDFRIKGDVSTPIVATTMFCSGMLDLVHILASQGLILRAGHLNFISVYTWTFSRTFNALLLLLGAGMFFIQSDNLFKNVKKHNWKFLFYVLIILSCLTAAYIFFIADLDGSTEERLRPFVLSRKLDYIPLVLYLFCLTIIFPKFYTNHPSIFSQTLLLSLVPSISAQLHVVAGPAVPYDNLTMIAIYEKLISYLIPFIGIAMNYLQTHYREVDAISRYRAESNKKNQANALLEGVMDVSLSGILVFETLYDAKGDVRDFCCIKFNRTAPAFVNAEVSENTLFSDIFHDDNKISLEACKKLVTENKPYDQELFNSHLNKWLRISAVQYRNGFVMTIMDITESKDATEVIRRREEMLSQAEEIAQLGSWELDTRTGRMTISPHLFKLYGINPLDKELTLDKLYNAIHPDDILSVKSSIEEALVSKDHFDMEFRRVLSDSTILYIASRARIKRNGSGAAEKVLGISMDITSRTLVSEKLRTNEILYRTFASNMPDSEVILFDTFFRINLVEGNMDSPLLTDKADLTGQDVREVLAKYEIPVDLSEILDETTPAKSVSTLQTDGRYFRIHLVRISGQDGNVFSGMILFQDITEIKKAELQLELKIQDLDRSNRELENFAYVASHDLQEPLRKITAFGDRLKVKYTEALAGEGADYIRRMTDATSRMQRLITDLLAFSRITRIAEPFEKVDFNKLIKEILSDIEIKVIATDADIKVEPLESLEGIPSQMHQLFQNLLLNALKFHKPGQKPVIHISGEWISAKVAGKSGNRKYYRFSIKDEGIGFEQKYAERIFTLFQRLHGRAEYEGTGIGLALCKKIAEHHDGSIEAFGTEGVGAEFVIILPMTQIKKDTIPTDSGALTTINL